MPLFLTIHKMVTSGILVDLPIHNKCLPQLVLKFIIED